ncbi:type II toxin-antitoxin system HicB family antitoxin [Halosimplex pelagicum]|uniref:Type II toxin-antitoxin system HicB family antitoxin n=1 Tax=Halosimplex pelagicum TaxID=869886 RepID=A0A7D5P4R4_9EURY|nr:hypothetical protein [Halosimplex pelagicum]QLH80826.1 hypothetical protein HZS54_03860 [Halosimplex pelagicum]
MSSEAEEPPSTKITLTYEGGNWVARDDDTGMTREGGSRSEALAALDAAIEGAAGAVDPDDPFWDADPVAVDGPSDLSASVDDYLYGQRAPDDE